MYSRKGHRLPKSSSVPGSSIPSLTQSSEQRLNKAEDLLSTPLPRMPKSQSTRVLSANTTKWVKLLLM